MYFPKRPHSDHVLFISTVRSTLLASNIFAGSAQGWVVFNKSSQRTWKTLEDVGRRGWKTWEASRNRLEDVILILKRRKASFLFLNLKFTSSKRFCEASPRLPATSSNVFQHLPCALRQFLAIGVPQAYISEGRRWGHAWEKRSIKSALWVVVVTQRLLRRREWRRQSPKAITRPIGWGRRHPLSYR